jgi:DNA-binding phage protein
MQDDDDCGDDGEGEQDTAGYSNHSCTTGTAAIVAATALMTAAIAPITARANMSRVAHAARLSRAFVRHT